MENTKITAEVQAKREAYKALCIKRRDDQKDAFAKLTEAVSKSQDTTVKSAFQAFMNVKAVKAGGGAGAGTALFTRFVKFVEEKKSVTEDVVFKDFKVGRRDCAGFIRRYLKECEPKNRIWINFTPSDGVYKMIGTGIKAPAEYTGYVPTDDVTDLKTPAAMK